MKKVLFISLVMIVVVLLLPREKFRLKTVERFDFDLDTVVLDYDGEHLLLEQTDYQSSFLKEYSLNSKMTTTKKQFTDSRIVEAYLKDGVYVVMDLLADNHYYPLFVYQKDQLIYQAYYNPGSSYQKMVAIQDDYYILAAQQLNENYYCMLTRLQPTQQQNQFIEAFHCYPDAKTNYVLDNRLIGIEDDLVYIVVEENNHYLKRVQAGEVKEKRLLDTQQASYQQFENEALRSFLETKNLKYQDVINYQDRYYVIKGNGTKQIELLEILIK